MTPEFLIQVGTQLKEAREAKEIVEKECQLKQEQLDEQKPLVDFANHVSDTTDLLTIGQMANLANDKGIKVGQNRLFSFLRQRKILKLDNCPYQKYMDCDYFKVKESVYYHGRNKDITYQPLVTGKGQMFIIRQLKKYYI